MLNGYTLIVFMSTRYVPDSKIDSSKWFNKYRTLCKRRRYKKTPFIYCHVFETWVVCIRNESPTVSEMYKIFRNKSSAGIIHHFTITMYETYDSVLKWYNLAYAVFSECTNVSQIQARLTIEECYCLHSTYQGSISIVRHTLTNCI